MLLEHQEPLAIKPPPVSKPMQPCGTQESSQKMEAPV